MQSNLFPADEITSVRPAIAKQVLGDVFSITEKTPPIYKPLLIVSPFTSTQPYIPFTCGFFNGLEFKSRSAKETIMNVLYWAELLAENIPDNNYEEHVKGMEEIEKKYEAKIISKFLKWAIKKDFTIGETDGKPFYIKDMDCRWCRWPTYR